LPIVVMDLLHTSTDPSRGAGVTTSLVPDKLLHPQRHRRRNGPAEALNARSTSAPRCAPHPKRGECVSGVTRQACTATRIT
jgi:hypothetical protein